MVQHDVPIVLENISEVLADFIGMILEIEKHRWGALNRINFLAVTLFEVHYYRNHSKILAHFKDVFAKKTKETMTYERFGPALIIYSAGNKNDYGRLHVPVTTKVF